MRIAQSHNEKMNKTNNNIKEFKNLRYFTWSAFIIISCFLAFCIYVIVRMHDYRYYLTLLIFPYLMYAADVCYVRFLEDRMVVLFPFRVFWRKKQILYKSISSYKFVSGKGAHFKMFYKDIKGKEKKTKIPPPFMPAKVQAIMDFFESFGINRID